MEVDREARGRDRRAAARQVRDALARGRIVAADADLRLTQVASATMVSDLDRLVRDLAPDHAYAPPDPAPAGLPAGATPAAPTAEPTAAAPTSPPPAHSPPPHQRLRRSRRPRRRRRTASPVAIVVTAGVLGASLFAARGGSDLTDEAERATSIGATPDGLLTEPGWREVVDAVVEETGRTEVFSLVVHPTYAQVSLPDDGTGPQGRFHRYDEDGLAPTGQPQTSRAPRLDLARVEPRAVVVAVREARAALDDAAGVYVVLVPTDRGFELMAVAGDETDALVTARTSPSGRVRSVTGP